MREKDVIGRKCRGCTLVRGWRLEEKVVSDTVKFL